LAMIAEKLKLKFPYIRGEKNDQRMATEFLERIIADGRRAFRHRVADDYAPFEEPLAIWEEARDLLTSWGNRASHGGSLVPAEARRLIDRCERALQYFHCTVCSDFIWRADVAAREYVQCTCGSFRWKYS
jgi:hypothetical protein